MSSFFKVTAARDELFLCFLDKLSVETLRGAVFMMDEVFEGILFSRRSVFDFGLCVWC